jgi:hypothetical protein
MNDNKTSNKAAERLPVEGMTSEPKYPNELELAWLAVKLAEYGYPLAHRKDLTDILEAIEDFDMLLIWTDADALAELRDALKQFIIKYADNQNRRRIYAYALEMKERVVRRINSLDDDFSDVQNFY